MIIQAFFSSRRIISVAFQHIRSQAALSLLLLVLLLSCFACAPGALQNPYPGIRDINPAIKLCTKNADCLEGQICYKRYCKSLAQPRGQIVSLHLVPPSGHRLLHSNQVVIKQQFIGIDIGRLTDRLPIVMRRAYTIKGLIQTSQSRSSVQSTVRFIDKETIRGNPIIVQAESNASGHFQIELTHGTYQVEITPKDGKYPTHRIPAVNIEAQKEYTFTLPDDKKYPRLTGRIVTPGPKSEAVPGLRILVFSAEGHIISNAAETDHNGVFRMRLSAKEKPHHIRILMRHPSTEKPVFPHPQVDIPFAPERVLPGELIDLGDIPAGYKASPLTLSGVIKASNQHPDWQELPYSNVHILGTIQIKGIYKGVELQGHYRIDTTSDNTGKYIASILPGNYTIEVLPSSNMNHTWSRASIHVGQVYQDRKDIDISLQPRLIVSGKVCQTGQVGECKKPLPKTQIKAIWRNILAPAKELSRPAIPSMFNPTQNADDPTGIYKLALDPGVYDLLFIPPKGSGLARRIYSGIRIESGSNQSKITHHAYLKAARHLVSTIVGPDQFPIPNTIVEMYTYSLDPKTPVYLLGRATSNELGEFSLSYQIPSQP